VLNKTITPLYRLTYLLSVAVIFVTINVSGQIFIPFGFWSGYNTTINYAPVISTITNRNIYEGNYPYIPFTISDPNDILSCSLTHLTRASTNTTVVPLANITFTGAVPFCYVNIVPAAGQAGTSTITITVNDNGMPNLQASTVFTVTSYTIQSLTVVPVFTIIPQNTTFQYRAMATYSDASTQDVSSFVTWSEDRAETTISSSGLVTVGAVTGYPTLTVSATYSPYSAQATATLNNSTITGLFTTPTAISINPSNTEQIRCYVTTTDGGTLDFTNSCTWTTSNSSIANVNDYYPKGEVTAYTVGGPITVTAQFGSVSDTTSVTVTNGAESETVEGIGLFARYFTGMGFTTFFRQRVDSTIDFSWGTGSNPAGGANTFSVRWTGQLLAPETGTYRFYSNSDDGFRIWVNNTLVEDFWTDHGPTDSTSLTIALTAGTQYNIVVEFYENGGDAISRLKWRLPSSACASFAACPVIPRANLFPDSGYGMPLDLAGVSDMNPGDRDFTNDNFVRHYNADGTGNIANGATIAATVGTGTLTAINTNGTGFSYGTGIIGQAFSFDGVDDRFTAPNTGLPVGTTARGFSMWLRPTNTGSSHGVFYYGAGGSGNGFGGLIQSDGVFELIGGGSQSCTTAAGSIIFDSWNHVAIRRVAGTANISIYVNGVTTSCGNRDWNTSAGDLNLGYSPSPGTYYTGLIDEFGVWNVNIAANTNNFLPTLLYQRQNPTPAYTP
jgi:hypothetical protein